MSHRSHIASPASSVPARAAGILAIVLGTVVVLALAVAMGGGSDRQTAEPQEAIVVPAAPGVAVSSIRPGPTSGLRDRLDSEYLRELAGTWGPTPAPVDPALLQSGYLREILGGVTSSAED